ncbi:MAG TPA: UDP-2,3-diacylglucosamine diphosphatase [Thermoanaerobaculia bacterium]
MIPPGRIFVIGDSHIGLADGSEQPVNAWLDRLVALKPAALYLNGDLFHYLIAHKKFFTKSVDKVFRKFRQVRDAGVPIHYVEGNRDFFLKGSFVEEAVTSVGLEYTIDAGPRKYLIIHGDMINDSDWPYRFWRRASKNPLTKLGVSLIPGKTARKFVNDVEARLSKSNFKHKSRLPLELFEAYGRKRGERGYTDVVFGHFHQKLVLPTPGATIEILPPWYEQGEAMVIDPTTGEYEFQAV